MLGKEVAIGNEFLEISSFWLMKTSGGKDPYTDEDK